jgi:hypothetical protein
MGDRKAEKEGFAGTASKTRSSVLRRRGAAIGGSPQSEAWGGKADDDNAASARFGCTTARIELQDTT